MRRLVIAFAIGLAGSAAIVAGAGTGIASVDPCAAYYKAHPGAFCHAPLVTMLWALTGVAIMTTLVAPVVVAIHPWTTTRSR